LIWDWTAPKLCVIEKFLAERTIHLKVSSTRVQIKIFIYLGRYVNNVCG